MKTYIVGTHKKRLAEALLMSTHNIICFRGKNKKTTVFDLITALCAKVFQNYRENLL